MPTKTAFLVHGFLNRALSMRLFQGELERRGYFVVNLDYPSRSKTIEEHADWLREQIQNKGRGDLYFIGHSMGSIIIRQCLVQSRFPTARRFVMIAPPNHGSHAADILRRFKPYKAVMGEKSGRQLQASNRDYWSTLPVPPVEFGIVAGGKGDARGLNPFLGRDNDGTVLVCETLLRGAKDFALIPYQHTAMLFHQQTVRSVVRFLETGAFR